MRGVGQRGDPVLTGTSAKPWYWHERDYRRWRRARCTFHVEPAVTSSWSMSTPISWDQIGRL